MYRRDGALCCAASNAGADPAPTVVLGTCGKRAKGCQCADAQATSTPSPGPDSPRDFTHFDQSSISILITRPKCIWSFVQFEIVSNFGFRETTRVPPCDMQVSGIGDLVNDNR